jgi:vancomycin resistance protein YoaR
MSSLTDIGRSYRRYRQPRRASRLILAVAGVLAATLASTVLVGGSVEEERRVEATPQARTLAFGDVSWRVSAAELERLVSVDPAHAAARLEPGLERRFRAFESAPRDTRLRIVEGDASVVQGVPGRELDAPATVTALLAAGSASTVAPVFRAVPPSVTTEALSALLAAQRVGEFTTHFAADEPRVTNIVRAAGLLDGTILEPGEAFSMNEALGERTIERGFVPAPTIYGGRLVDSVGGGISQVATTLYNAAFFAGLELVEHTPHSFYIDRYPPGREATISWGGPELVFRNDWPAAALLRVTTTPTSVTVRVQSEPLGRRVETTTNEPTRWVSPVTRIVTDPSLPSGTRVRVQEAGGPGFTVEYTRRVYRDGRLIRDDRFVTRYVAKDAIVAVGPSRPLTGR